jgi:hypothetical protein
MSSNSTLRTARQLDKITMNLAEAIHSLCPHAVYHSWDGCPQRDHDEREAVELEAALALRGIELVES